MQRLSTFHRLDVVASHAASPPPVRLGPEKNAFLGLGTRSRHSSAAVDASRAMSTRANDRKRRARSIASAFRVLRLDVGASAAEVKSAYKTLARAHHPDETGGDADAFLRRIQEAYEKILAKHERHRDARWR